VPTADLAVLHAVGVNKRVCVFVISAPRDASGTQPDSWRFLMASDEAVDASLDKFDVALDSLEAAAQPFLACDMQDVGAQLGPIDRAQLRVAMAYATASTYFSALCCQRLNMPWGRVFSDLFVSTVCLQCTSRCLV